MPKQDLGNKQKSANGLASVTHLLSANNPNEKRNASKPGDDVIIDLGNFKKGARIHGRITKIVKEKL